MSVCVENQMSEPAKKFWKITHKGMLKKLPENLVLRGILQKIEFLIISCVLLDLSSFNAVLLDFILNT